MTNSAPIDKKMLAVALVLTAVLVPCGQVEADESNRPADELAASVKQIFRTRCAECHGTTRREADINILEHASFVGDDRAVVPGSVDQSVLYDYVASDDEDFRMPEAPLPPLSQFEVETIRQWIGAGAPEFPEDVARPDEGASDEALSGVIGSEYVLKQILKHVQDTPREDRRFLRYFSSNHLLTNGATAAELKENHQALAKAINHLSWQPEIVRPIIIDSEIQTVFAVDIRQLGWHATPYSEVVGEQGQPVDVNLFDLVLLEYPYGIAFENSDTFDQLWDAYLERAKLIRPVPFVRIDWFVSTATRSPLYEDILQLPHELDILEKELGIDAEGNMRSFVAKRAGMTLSGVSRNNRVVERHPSRYGAYWKSYDFQTSTGLQNMFADPIDFHYAGGEMIWNLPNGLQGYFITDTAGNRLLEAPTTIVTDKFAEDKVVRNGMACMRCHDRGMKRFADNVRPAFEGLPDTSGLQTADILKLYLPKNKMDALLDRDEERFLSAMEKAFGEPQRNEPLIPVSRKFLDAPLTLTQAAAELGMRDSAGLKKVFRLPQFTQLGLAGLAGGSVIRRDTWEDYFDRVVRQLGVGVPVPPVDGVTRPDQLSGGLATGVKVSTNRRSNVFSPGDEMVVSVRNDTGVELFIELIGTSARGKVVELTSGVVSLPKGNTFRFPSTGSIRIRPQLGTEFITVFASPEKFEVGRLLRGNNLGDRFVHDFFRYDDDGRRVANDPSQLIKKTLRIETR